MRSQFKTEMDRQAVNSRTVKGYKDRRREEQHVFVLIWSVTLALK